MKISSPAFQHNDFIPSQYTCDGENFNPPLMIDDVPEAAISLVLIMDDPDAPMGTWVHWIVWNIDVDTMMMDEDSVPENAEEGITSFGRTGYGGPCPPSGVHRYFFKIYALDCPLDLSSTATKKDLEQAMVGHVINEAELMGLYKRS